MEQPIANRDVHVSRPPVQGQTVYDFRVPRRDWAAERLGHMPWADGTLVLDAGCGPGGYVAATRQRIGSQGAIVGLDLNIERVATADTGAGIVGDVEALPFDGGVFDVVLAMHMLYHVPDVEAAVREFRRVLRAGGTLLVSTNSVRDEPEVIDLFLRAGGTDTSAFGDWRFCVENAGGFLRGPFDDVELHTEESTLDVPVPGPVVNSFDSQKYLLESKLQPGLTWASFLNNVRAEVALVIEREELFRITCVTGLFVCR